MSKIRLTTFSASEEGIYLKLKREHDSFTAKDDIALLSGLLSTIKSQMDKKKYKINTPESELHKFIIDANNKLDTIIKGPTDEEESCGHETCENIDSFLNNSQIPDEVKNILNKLLESIK